MKEGWEIKKLGDVCTLYNGRAYKKVELLNEGKYPVLRVGNFFTNNTWYHSDLELEENKYCVEGDLLYAWSASFGPRIWTGSKVIYHYHIWKVVPNEGIDRDFLFHLLEWDKEKIKKAHGTGTTMMHVGKGSMEKRKLPIPPLSEQQRIVSILDRAFAVIDQARANAEKNLQNSKELFESYLQGVFEKKGDGWEEKKLGEICNVIGGGTPSKANSKFYDGDIYWATVRDMKGEVISDTEHKITEEAVINSSTNIIPKGNVVIATRVGLGKVCLIANDTAINQDLRGVVPINSKKLAVDFLYHWFKSIAHKIVEEGTGATVQGVKLPFIKSLSIPLPPLKTQQTIVRQLDALRAETQNLEAIYQQKMDDLEELKKSILEKAFAGELTGKEVEV